MATRIDAADIAADIAADTRVTALAKAPGWYTANLSSAWDFHTPSGGVLMTIALRAMQAELAEAEMAPVGASTLFMSPVPSGPLEVRVELLRKGGAAAQLRAALSSSAYPGPGLEVSATFGRERRGPEFTDPSHPDVDDPDSLPRYVDRMQTPLAVPFFENLEMRHAFGPEFFMDDFEAGPARVMRWMRYLITPRLPDGRFDPLAIPPLADTMPPSVKARLGPDVPFYAPSLDLTVHFLQDTSADWLLLDVYSRHAGAGYATAAVDIWGDGELVAFATQTMILVSEG